MAVTQGREPRPMIITFKKKDQRQDRQLDKQEILKQHIKTRLDFCSVVSMQDMSGVPSDFEETPMALDINLYDLPIIAGNFTDDEIRSLEGDPNIQRVEPDPIAYAMPLGQSPEPFVPGVTEPLAEDAGGALTERLPWGVNRIDAERAWEVTRGAGIKVAVIDTGIDYQHHDLRPNFEGGVSFVPGESFTDGNGHGTMVAGIIGARQNGSGVIGVAPNCGLFSVKALDRMGRGRYSWIISALMWCVRNRIDVVNMSLGGSQDIQALQDACDYAFEHNVVLVAAAGNKGPGTDTVCYPGRYESVLAVSAMDESGDIANFSSRGRQIDLAAPGEHILSTLPGNRYGRQNGTSMAAPHVAGTAALALSSHRFSNAQTIRRILLEAADNRGIPERDDNFGFGLVDAEQSAFLRTLH